MLALKQTSSDSDTYPEGILKLGHVWFLKGFKVLYTKKIFPTQTCPKSTVKHLQSDIFSQGSLLRPQGDCVGWGGDIEDDRLHDWWEGWMRIWHRQNFSRGDKPVFSTKGGKNFKNQTPRRDLWGMKRSFNNFSVLVLSPFQQMYKISKKMAIVWIVTINNRHQQIL